MAAKHVAHASDSTFHDALHRSPPASVERPYSSTRWIDYQNRHAIGNLNCQQHIPVSGDNPVALQGSPGYTILTLDDVNYSRVDLSQTDEVRERSLPTGQLTNKNPPIALHRLPAIRRCEAQVQLIPTIFLCEASRSRAKSVNYFWKCGKIRRPNNLGRRSGRRPPPCLGVGIRRHKRL